MRIKVNPPSDTFPEVNSESDVIDRVALATSLTSLYQSMEGSSVAILHGRWGVGKSTFAKRWIKDLENEGFGTIYFDAFSYDYMGEPFDALLSEVIRRGQEINGADDNKIERLKERAAAVSRALAVTGVKAGMRVATLNLIDVADFELIKAASSGVAGDVADAAKEAAKNLLERRATDVAAFESFRKALADIHDVSGADDADETSSKKTIFVVDELDRCRPDFALSLLESMKHFFQTEGLHFVLVTNRNYLSKSVDARYGLGENSDEYLQKFYDFIIHFEQRADESQQSASAYFGKIIVRKLLNGQKREVVSQMESLIAAFAKAFDLTLRQVEHLGANLALSYLSLKDNRYSPPILIMYLSYLKTAHPNVFADIKLGNLKFSDAKAIISQGKWPSNFNYDRLLSIIQFHTDAEVDLRDERFQGYNQSLSSYFIKRMNVLPFLANNVLDNFSRS